MSSIRQITMNTSSGSVLDMEEYMASYRPHDCATNDMISTDESTDSASEIEIVKELKVTLDEHHCKLCSEGAQLVNKLLQFGGVLDDERKHACDICDKGFTTKSHLTRHKAIHKRNTKSTNGVNPSESSLNVSGEDLPEPPRIACDSCSKTFKTQQTFLKHKRFQHGTGLTHLCEVCDAKFTSFKLFNQHCIAHNNSKQGLSCITCKKTFVWKKSLKCHVCKI